MEHEKNQDGTVTLTDAKGRQLTVKEPDFLQSARLTRLCGESATNRAYMFAFVYPTVSVVAIDGEPVLFPVNFRELEGLMQRVGREGCDAVLQHLNNQVESEEREEAVKN